MRKVYYIRRPRRSVHVKPAWSRGELTNEAGAGASATASTAPLSLASAWIPRPFALGSPTGDGEFLSDGAAAPKKGEARTPTGAGKLPSTPQNAAAPAQPKAPARSVL